MRKERPALHTGMELLAACQGIDLRGKKKLGKGTEIVYNIVRSHLSTIEEDRIMYKEIDTSEELIKSNIILKEVEGVVGKLL